MAELLLSTSPSHLIIETSESTLELSISKAELVLGGAGAKGQTGQGFDLAQVSWQLFQRASIATRDDDLFPTLIAKTDYEGLTNGTVSINRNVGNNLIIDSIVETYDYQGSNYEWTTTYIETSDILKNRPGTPTVVIV